MGGLVASQLAGFLLGILTSFLSWWLLSRYLVPRVRFSPCISKIPSEHDKSGWRYRVKFENSGRRTIIDVECLATFRTKGRGPRHPRTWDEAMIPLGPGGVESWRFPRLRPVRVSGMRQLLTLHTSHAPAFQELTYPEGIRKKAQDGTLLLEDVLALGTSAELQVWVFGYDEVSGTRRLFTTVYHATDIVEGSFDTGSLNIEKSAAGDAEPAQASPRELPF